MSSSADFLSVVLIHEWMSLKCLEREAPAKFFKRQKKCLILYAFFTVCICVCICVQIQYVKCLRHFILSIVTYFQYSLTEIKSYLINTNHAHVTKTAAYLCCFSPQTVFCLKIEYLKIQNILSLVAKESKNTFQPLLHWISQCRKTLQHRVEPMQQTPHQKNCKYQNVVLMRADN